VVTPAPDGQATAAKGRAPFTSAGRLNKDFVTEIYWIGFSDEFRYTGSEYCPILTFVSLPEAM
jgi:hypothetical protein